MSLEAGTGFYYGSRLLQPVGDALGLSIDQTNFIACQLTAIIIAIPFRSLLHPANVSPTVRHIFEIIMGFILLSFCFGSQAIHVFLQAILCYTAMHILPSRVHVVCFIISLGYLSVLHIYRMVYDYGGYTLDITGPLMITTQKLSDLAFSLHDGMVKKEEDLNPSQLKYALKRNPSLIELLSYVLSFHNVMIGPCIFYKDYYDFITGKNIGLGKAKYKETGEYDSPALVTRALKNTVICGVCVYIFLILSPQYPPNFREESYLNASFLYKVAYMVFAITLVRARYYFAWCLAELTNIIAGLGFNGLLEDGTEDWSIINNANILGVETCTSMKICMDSWNISTLAWLRRTVYERAYKFNTLAVFTVSAFWHGFYPGYYLAFFTGALFIEANRSIRRFIRPYFQASKISILIYDAITFVGTRCCCAYMVVPMLIYEFKPTVAVYMSQYCWMHILGLAAVIFLPRRPSSRAKAS